MYYVFLNYYILYLVFAPPTNNKTKSQNSFPPRHASCKIFEKLIKRLKLSHRKLHNPRISSIPHVNVVRIEHMRVKLAYFIESNMYVHNFFAFFVSLYYTLLQYHKNVKQK